MPGMFKTLKDRFNQLGERFSLHRLSDRHLHLATRTSKVMAMLTGAHAGVWVAIGVVGGVALGLNAAGLAVPAVIGVSTLVLGGILTAKSLIFNRAFSSLHKACAAVMEKRGLTPKPWKPAPLAALQGKLAKLPSIRSIFSRAAGKKAPSPPARPAPEAKPAAPKP